MSLDSDKGLTQHVELFRRHSKRLSIVAQAAAQSTADALRKNLKSRSFTIFLKNGGSAGSLCDA